MANECNKEFNDIIDSICQCAPDLPNPNDQKLVNQWVNKLERENYSDEACLNRNDYARYLQHQVHQQDLHFPFACQPPKGPLERLDVLEEKRAKKSIWPASCSEKKTKEPNPTSGKSETISSSTASVRVYGHKEKKEAADVVDCNRLLLRKIIAELGSHMSLPQFVGLVSPQTCDRGSILRKVMGEEQVSFRNFVERAFATRNTDVGELLAREQCALQERYETWRQRMLNRQAQSEALLLEIVPDFDWEAYAKDPHYLSNLFDMKKEKPPCKPDETFKEWRQHMMHKIAFMRDQVKEIIKQNEDLTQQLSVLRREHHERQTEDTLNEQMLHEKNHALAQTVKDLRQRRDFNLQRIDALFQQLEACECRKDEEESDTDK